jgi:hypothetical protein
VTESTPLYPIQGGGSKRAARKCESAMATRRLMILAAGLVTLACGGEALDVGSNRDPADGLPGAGNGGEGARQTDLVLPTWPAPAACTMGGDLPMTGVWEGHVTTADVSPVLEYFRVAIGQTSLGGVCGSVVYGQGVAPPPASDPDAGYPDAATDYPKGRNEGGVLHGSPHYWGPMAGVPYSILEATNQALRVRFKTASGELWKDWCALQIPVLASSDPQYPRYSCLRAPAFRRSNPDGCFVSATGNPGKVAGTFADEMPIDCFKVSLCSYGQVCACNAQECRASQNDPLEFNLLFAGDQASGTVIGDPSMASYSPNELSTVTLRRIQ